MDFEALELWNVWMVIFWHGFVFLEDDTAFINDA